MSTEVVMVPCPHCKLTPVRLDSVNPALAATLQLLKRQKRPISTLDLWRLDHVSNLHLQPTGMCNRLANLEAYGLVRHEKRGKAKYWTAL